MIGHQIAQAWLWFAMLVNVYKVKEFQFKYNYYKPVWKILEVIFHAGDTWSISMCIKRFRLNKTTFKNTKKKEVLV